MNVFDFDGTIIDGDTATEFYLFTLRRHPRLLRRLPQAFAAWGLRKLKLISSVQMRNLFYPTFLPYLDVPYEAMIFWKQRKKKIKQWYLDIKQTNDVITTASPDCLVRPMMEELGVQWIATRVDLRTGNVIGADNRDARKPINFLHRYPGAKIDKFYSDSMVDEPMAVMAKKAFLVRGDKISPWPNRRK